ncbi:MAG: hypothetical protein IJ428_02140 [Clostridia bacterium]|nr:hypothetical protein [Clostridia bacterium]
MPTSDNTTKKPRKIKPEGADGHRSRMFTKFLNASDRDVLPRDIVEMLLYFSIPVRDTRDSAVHLMNCFDGDIRKLLNAPADILQETDGIGPSSAMLLNLVGHIADRLESEDADTRPRLSTTEDICGLFLDHYSFPSDDELWLAFFDNSMRAVILKFKDAPIEVYFNDIYELLRLSSKYHSQIFVLARMSYNNNVFPIAEDAMIIKFVTDMLQGSELSMLDYLIVSADEAISINKHYDLP